jgi:PQQ system protein
MEGTLTILEDSGGWEPAVLVMPHGGRIELTVVNDDKNTHSALFPSNGDKQYLGLLNHSRGRATLILDGPGFYWYSSPGGNDEGRGLTAAIVVLGEVPPEARLDRPDQPRP